jgi:ABC-type nitrate/sulfonate/bicarbonate transport system substrate-binding protein
MEAVRFSLLRGVCQTPAYVAKKRGFFEDAGIDARIEIAPTAWVVPKRLAAREIDFAVLPWTRVATAKSQNEDLVLLCGSGHEEAALVVRPGMKLEDVKKVAVPQEGGMKDLTAAGLMRSLGLGPKDTVRLPSGDGAILAFVGQGAHAAVMIEPYASMLEHLGLGEVVRRTGDVWPGAPGCSLATSRALLRERPDLARAVVGAYVRGAQHVHGSLDDAADAAAPYIGVSVEILRRALAANRPDVRALYNHEAMERVLDLMTDLGYIDERPKDYAELSFLDEALAQSGPATTAAGRSPE